MSKVKRLRKKYRALCSKAQQASDNLSKNVDVDDNQQSSSNSSKSDRIASRKKREKSQLNSLYSSIIDTKGSSSVDLDSRSNYSISKSIKSNLSGHSILKKDKQRLKHELFMQKLESSAEMMNSLKKPKKSKRRRPKKTNPSNKVPLLTGSSTNAEKSDKSYGFVANKLKTPMKNLHSGKGLNKRRNEQMIKDIEQFQNLLSKDLGIGSRFDEIQRRILDRLSAEAIESNNVGSDEK